MIDWIREVLGDHWPSVLLSALSLAAGAWWGRLRARRQWDRKEFLHRLNVSLNSLRGGMLQIRTVLEKDLHDVLLNRVAVKKVLDAATHATETDPLLRLSKDDAWYLLNGVLNEVSEQFAEGVVRRDMGLEVTSNRYLLCLTYEVDGAIRTRKVRAMLVKRETLEHLPEEMPRLESPNHVTRWRTLQKMAEAYATSRHLFLEIEIAL